MRTSFVVWSAAALFALYALPASAQEKGPAPAEAKPAEAKPADPDPTPATPPPARTAVAATVNGQPLLELAVYRSLKKVPAAKHDDLRPEVLNFLIDNILIDQYLTEQKVTVDPKDVEAKVKDIHDEVKKKGTTFEKVLQELSLTEEELRYQITSQLRWEKYAADQATDKALHELFDTNPEMFDGTQVSARHILLMPPAGDAKAGEEARARLVGFKKQIGDEVEKGLAKLPADADQAKKDKERAKLTDEAFAAIASKESACPSKADGGNLDYFPRVGSMVEPFAKAAFALKPYEISDVVSTQFGYHLIMVKDRKAGTPTKFDEAKDDVKEVYGDRLHEELAARLRQTAKIVVNPPTK